MGVWAAARVAVKTTDRMARTMARPAGLEPATPSLEGSCSIQLSYGRTPDGTNEPVPTMLQRPEIGAAHPNWKPHPAAHPQHRAPVSDQVKWRVSGCIAPFRLRSFRGRGNRRPLQPASASPRGARSPPQATRRRTRQPRIVRQLSVELIH